MAAVAFWQSQVYGGGGLAMLDRALPARILRVMGRRLWLDMRGWRSYRASFWLGVTGDVTWLLFSMVFFDSIYTRVGEVGGWRWPDVLLLIGTAQLIEGVYSMLFARNVKQLSSGVRSGSLDRLLLYPADPQLLLAVGRVDLRGLLTAVLGLAIVFYGLQVGGWRPDALQAVLYVLMVVGGVLVRLGSAFLIETLSFVFVDIGVIRALQDEFFSYAAYPQSVYPGLAWKLVFTIFIPVLWMANLPVSALRGGVGVATWLLFPILLILISRVALSFALRGYQSAGG